MNLRTKLRIKLNGDLKESNLMLDFRGNFLVAILDFFDELICFRWGMAKAQVCEAGGEQTAAAVQRGQMACKDGAKTQGILMMRSAQRAFGEWQTYWESWESWRLTSRNDRGTSLPKRQVYRAMQPRCLEQTNI